MAQTRDGGKPILRDVPNYSPPQGPKHQYDVGPGLHSNNYGNCGTQCGGGSSAETSGRPGLRGDKPSLRQGQH